MKEKVILFSYWYFLFLFCSSLLDNPSVSVQSKVAGSQRQNILLLLSQIGLIYSIFIGVLMPKYGGLLVYLGPFPVVLSRCPDNCLGFPCYILFLAAILLI